MIKMNFEVKDVVKVLAAGVEGIEGIIKEVYLENQECLVRYPDPEMPDYFTTGYFSFSELKK
jgi:hypothetical protein